MPKILDGVAIAAAIRRSGREVRALAAKGIQPDWRRDGGQHGRVAHLCPQQGANLRGAGIFSELITRPAAVTTAELLELVASLNARDEIDGISRSVALPAHVNAKQC